MQNILIIDDELNILIMLKKMLTRSGYKVNIASDGKEGLGLFKAEPPDLVITDIIMPEKEGLETIREMKMNRPDLKIIAMSGGGKISADSYLDVAAMFGADKVIEKPFSQRDMLSLVNELMAD